MQGRDLTLIVEFPVPFETQDYGMNFLVLQLLLYLSSIELLSRNLSQRAPGVRHGELTNVSELRVFLMILSSSLDSPSSIVVRDARFGLRGGDQI